MTASMTTLMKSRGADRRHSAPASSFSIMPVNAKNKMFHEQKVVILGEKAVGKTRLLLRMARKPIDTELQSPSIEGDYLVKMAPVDGLPVKIQLWDTAGQEKYGVQAIVNAFYRNAQGALLVYDVANRRSFDAVINWAKQLERLYRGLPFAVVVVGNKADIQDNQREVSFEEGNALAELLQAGYIECSAMREMNVETCFQDLATRIRNGTMWNVRIPTLTPIKPTSFVHLPQAKVSAKQRSCDEIQPAELQRKYDIENEPSGQQVAKKHGACALCHSTSLTSEALIPCQADHEIKHELMDPDASQSTIVLMQLVMIFVVALAVAFIFGTNGSALEWILAGGIPPLTSWVTRARGAHSLFLAYM